MFSALVHKTILGIDSVWFLTIFIMVLGVILIFAAIKLKNHVTTHHFVRDIGIAFFIAGLITIIYEHVVDFRRMSDAISIIVGTDVPPPVLNAVTSHVFKKEVIRENLELRWSVQPDNSLPEDQALIKIHISYDLYGLKQHPFDFIVRQELEHFNIQNANGTLPRFDSVTVGDKVYKGEELNKLVPDGLLSLPPVTLNPWYGMDDNSKPPGNSGIRFIFERSEIVNIPGSYSTVLSQLTKGVRLEVEHPDNIVHKLKEWFDRGGQPFRSAGDKYYNLEGMVLPGQGISVQFSRTDKSIMAPGSSPSLRKSVNR